jgi:hypothetical protein
VLECERYKPGKCLEKLLAISVGFFALAAIESFSKKLSTLYNQNFG